MKRLLILFWSTLFLCTQSSWGQEGIAVSASLNKNSILIGEPVELTLQAVFPQTHTPSFFTLDSFAHFERLHQSKIDTQTTARGLQLQQTLTLTSWDSGVWYIPALTLEGTRTPRTKPLPIKVSFSPMDPNQPYHEIKDILNVQQPGRNTWYWYLIGAVLLLLLFLLLFPKKKKSPAEAVPDPNAYKQALAQLDQIKKEAAADSKVYFTGLVHIFRTYLHQRKGIQSHSKTTDDLSLQMKRLKLKEEYYHSLVQTLQLSDFVKFAKYTPTTEERDEAWNTIKKSIILIEQTNE